MSKIRLKFSKTGMGKYISHLDLLRTFTRAIHRAELPVKYSQGFNPHQLITFSLPLALGVTSETEFVDIDFEEGTKGQWVVEQLNKNLPPDIKIIGFSLPECKAKDIVSARYNIKIAVTRAENRKLEEFFAQKDIPAVKKTKRGEKEVNLREFIHSYEVKRSDSEFLEFETVLSAGGENNLKPDILVAKLCEFLGDIATDSFEIHRIEIYYNDGREIKKFY